MVSARNGATKRVANHPVERATRAVVFVDIVESVRLIEQDEEGVISRWLGLVDRIESTVLPGCHGRLVKRIGDGILLDFRHVRSAVSAALSIQGMNSRENSGLPADQQILLRMGIVFSEVILEGDDVYGRGVNLAARLMTLAGPGEIVISAQARQHITAALDADVEDLGECYLKHVPQPVRAFRIGPPGPRPLIKPGISLEDLLPSLAVVPFANRGVAREHHLLGEVLAEEMIRELSRSPDLSVISRLSTTAFCGRDASLEEISGHLNADYVLSGVYRTDDTHLALEAELAEARTGQIVWSDHLEGDISQVLKGERELIGRVVTDVAAAVMSRELQRARSQSLPTLKSYTLLMAAIALMHRLSRRDFEEARELLQTLLDRAARQSIPQAWMAKWYVLRVQQGWSPDPAQDGRFALECTRLALDADPDSSLALAIDGFVHTNLLKRLDLAQERYDRAIQINPNNALAWLLRGTLHAFMGEGELAVAESQRALSLTPLDPHRYFYDSLAATACFVAHQYEDSLRLAQRSLRANRMHTSTLRVMAAAQWRLGQFEEARKTARELLRLEPSLTVERWLARSPSAPFSVGKEFSKVLREVGVPG